MATVTTTIVYPDPLRRSATSTSSTLQPFFISVSFLGSLPPHLLTGEIPLQISVSLPQEYAPFTSPILTASPLSKSDSTLSLESEGKSQKACDDTTFPFLPLPRDFNCIRFESWAPVAGQIQEWLINIVANPRSQEWIWGRELFWIAFMAAYPHFPQGSWLVWNPKISMEGAFIQSWMESGFQNWGNTEDSMVLDMLKQLWDEFNRVASLFYDDQLVEASISSYN